MLQDLISDKKALFSDGLQTVLRGQQNRSRRVVLLNGSLITNARAEGQGVCARVNRNGVCGFSSMGEYSSEAAETVLKAASENALFLDRHLKEKQVIPPEFPYQSFLPHRDIVDFEQKLLVDTCMALDTYLAEHYPDLRSRRVAYTEDSLDKIICSSDAGEGHIVSPRCYIYVFLTGETKDGTPVELFKAFGGPGSFGDWFSDLNWMYEPIDKLYRMLRDKQEGIYAEAGMKTVILGGMMAGMLAHEAVGHTVEADLVMGGSVAGPSLNKEVASPLVSLVDFAHTALGESVPLPVFLDDEGIPAEDAVLIENGILKGYMHNRETAQHFGVTPQGNARGWSYSDEPLIRMRNTAVLPGKDTLEDMIASVEDGYYLIDSGNGQADLTGEFMFGVTMGYEIKNGKLGRALLDTTVTGVAFEMLKTVDMVSNHMTWSSSGFCGKKQMMSVSMGGPELRCRIMIGGR